MSNDPTLPSSTGSDSASNNNGGSSGNNALFLERVRAVLALIVVGFFMGITAVLLLYVLFSKTPVDLKDYAQFFSQTASVYTGIVGVVIGYYFGRSERVEVPRKAPAEARRPTPSSEGGGAGQSSSPPSKE